MQILAIETSTDACSLALYRDGEIFVKEAIIPQQHSQQLLPMLDVLLAETGAALSGCDAIAFGRGPGSFTGIRMAAGVAQGLAFGIDVPVIPISTLAALAWRAKQQQARATYVATLDARMHELYWAVYEETADGSWLERQAEQLSSYATLVTFLAAQSVEPFIVCGPGWSAYAPAVAPLSKLQCLPAAWPSAGAVAELAALGWGQGGELAAAEGLPTYVRNDVAQVKGSAKPRGDKVTS